MMWHLLQISDVLDIEFGSALSERVPLMAWEPERRLFPAFSRQAAQLRTIDDPPLTVHTFPLLRGYARPGWSRLARTGATVTEHLLRHGSDPEASPLICTTPYLAPVAERWPGPVVYWLTDRIERYDGVDADVIHDLDQRMCAAATLVCPNSQRLADYLMEEGACAPGKIRILPNATRACNVLPEPLTRPGALPASVVGVPRPIAGVIGNLAGNMDWLFMEQLIAQSPAFSWLLIGPSQTLIPDALQSEARERVLQLPSVHSPGRQPYGELAAFAHSFDVAVLPYRRCEPTYSGSSTRFYEHLAACRPMVATRGFEELLHKEPLLHLVDNAEEAAEHLERLRSVDFDDGLSGLRWEASQDATWQSRAARLERELRLATSAPAMQPV